MPSIEVNQNSSREAGGEFLPLLKVWSCKLAVCCQVCTDVCFSLAEGQECPKLLQDEAGDNPLAYPSFTAAWATAVQCT